ncbi:hypothetical protein LCL97_20945 [Seohaeicola saemankumensis]|nr:hypothetical protein [Seohaeicola saemankumensis]MCA0873306.1 hypothetical protein [Seohaeicola saemankumensis]
MKLFSVSIGLLLAALGVFFVPVSFAVDGFGLVVNPGGVRTVRAVEEGVVLHFPSDGGRFLPGEIVTAVVYGDAVAENALLEGTMRRELAKIETDYLEKTSKLIVDMERDRAKREATVQRLAARRQLSADTGEVLTALQEFTSASVTDIDNLNEERLAQLRRLEELVQKSGEVSALPAQRLATMLEDIQADRLSVITSKGTRFNSDKMILDMIKAQNDLTYDNSIDAAEVDILTDRIDSLHEQIEELGLLRDSQKAEAEARFLAKSVLPQVAVADGISVDMRTLQASRADVARTDPLRLLATRDPSPGLQILIYGEPSRGSVDVLLGDESVSLPLPADSAQISALLAEKGLAVAEVHSDRATVGSIDVLSVFIEFARDPDERLTVASALAHDKRDVPVMVTTSITLQESIGAGRPEGTSNEIIGFLENRHAVVLKPGQRVRGTINDTRTGSEIVFDAHLLKRDYATVDTKELGIRLGNQSLAAKIIKRGVLSQVVVGVDSASAQQIEHLPGAVVHLSFPLSRQSLFSFLLARDVTI